MKIELLIFDFDGTLVDTATDICEAINLLFDSRGIKRLSHEEIRPEIGMGLTTLLERTFPKEIGSEKTKLDISLELHKFYDEIHLNSPKLFDGAESLLKSWPGKVAIISNKPERYVHSILKHLKINDLPWVDILGGDSLAEKKPHPMPFEQVLKKANVSAESTLMIGDGEPDILGAKNAGIRSLAVEFGYGPIEVLKSLGAWKTARSYDEIVKLTESFS